LAKGAYPSRASAVHVLDQLDHDTADLVGVQVGEVYTEFGELLAEQHLDALRGQLSQCGVEVIHLKVQMMESLSSLSQELRVDRFALQHLNQLDLNGSRLSEGQLQPGIA